MYRGYYKIWRKLLWSDLWLSEPFTRGQAWIDLIGLAIHEDGGHVRKRGIKINLNRSQIGWSQTELAKRWKWSVGRLKRWLNELEIDEQIDIQKTNVSTTITILNYDKYQSTNRRANRRANRRTNELQTERRQTPNNNDNNDNNVNNEKKRERVNHKNALSTEINLPELKSQFPSVDVDHVHAQFQDYVASRPHNYDNYHAALRKWCRDEAKNQANSNGEIRKYYFWCPKCKNDDDIRSCENQDLYTVCQTCRTKYERMPEK